ncbi:non-hydrolyzing UDP-N-acetylglucosamine 2-epimerase [Nanoarchaeota archaeon]
MKIVTILGTRPEIIKLSPLFHLLDEDPEIEHVVIHTRQHYDYRMDRIFFQELGTNYPRRNIPLNVGSSSKGPIKQIAEMLVNIEEVLIKEKPDQVIVFADPNTPLAGALVAHEHNFQIIHLEAGCRSFNKQMPEERNRIACDHWADLLLAPDEEACRNLLREGLSFEKIYIVGSTAIEVSLRNVEFARKRPLTFEELRTDERIDFKKDEFILMTIHRAENTDNFEVLKGLMEAVCEIANHIPVIFPIHPRTKKILIEHGEYEKLSNKIKIIEPQGYLDFLNLLDNCLFVMSDSGGIQEEAAALNTPCLILRNETEWTYLVDAGKNLLIGVDKEKIIGTAVYLINNREGIQRIKNIPLNLNTNVSQKIIEVIKNESKR